MFFKENLILKLHNWRAFNNRCFNLPKQSFVIMDQNGSGKTSLISAFYSLFTGQVWPTTKLAQHLQINQAYFGVSSTIPDWSFNGQVGPSGRLSYKYQKPPDDFFANLVDTRKVDYELVLWPKILTYLPTDNYWFNQSRGLKLDILDNLLIQVLGDNYFQDLQKLQKTVKGKLQLIKRIQENPEVFDEALLVTLNQAIWESSQSIWGQRRTFFNYLQRHLSEFSAQIESPLKNWQIRWEVSGITGQKQTLAIQTAQTEDIFDNHKVDLLKLWQKEVITGKVLFGAQRDDFEIHSERTKVEDVLSRGEMRLLVLFIKNLGRLYLQQNSSNQPVFWLLDDIFNEFDTQREQIVVNSILNKTDYYIVTATQKPFLDIESFSLKQLDMKAI